ncbi:MAG TPA: hypothetical protein VGE94_17740, partial [Chloroflexota bacterium]
MRPVAHHALTAPLVSALAALAVGVVVVVLGGWSMRHLAGGNDAVAARAGRWQTFGSTAFVSPVGLAQDGAGNLYVVDAGSHHVYKLAADGSLLATFGSHGTAAGQFERPTAVALDAIGNLFVADTANSRIQKLSSTGVPLATWGSYGSAAGQFNGP